MLGNEILENYSFLGFFFFVILKSICCVILRYQHRSEAQAPQSTLSLHQQLSETGFCALLWDRIAIKDTKMGLSTIPE